MNIDGGKVEGVMVGRFQGIPVAFLSDCLPHSRLFCFSIISAALWCQGHVRAPTYITLRVCIFSNRKQTKIWKMKYFVRSLKLMKYLLHYVSEWLDWESFNKCHQNAQFSAGDAKKIQKTNKHNPSLKRLLICVDSKQRTERNRDRSSVWVLLVGSICLTWRCLVWLKSLKTKST